MAKNPIRNRIYRTVTLSYCIGTQVIEGESEEYYTILVGEYTPERATRKLRKACEDETITIREVNVETDKYYMDVLEFVRIAERSENGN